jgi:hypothetical protein
LLPPSDAGHLEIICEKQEDDPHGSAEFSTEPATEKPAPLLAA